ncbi:MAG: hypothetical protein A2297_00840 [Elusimicrobia bacterium RIFOXYB2_FULL_48_7]|nr:MAG: hypothetical protein A2297_00840 [Elusimicrobia bacterium RIFOXYB2_FULL_48_7]
MKNNKGFTLIEMMVAVVVFALVIPSIIMILSSLTRGFTSYEASSQIKNLNQNNLSKIYMKLTTSKRLFQNSTADNLFFSRIDTAGIPAALAALQMPSINEDGVLNPGTTSFSPSAVGNTLFFASNDSTQVLENISDGASTHTVSIDVYRFIAYYLSTDNPKTINAKPSYRLVEFTSLKYADYNQIMAISNATFRQNIAAGLYNSNVRFAWAPSATNPATAFSSITAAGGFTGSAGHMIQKDKCVFLTQIITGIMGVGYRYGVSPVSAGWAAAPKIVPVFATQNGVFPGGFEVVVVGHSGGRKTLIRQVIVAEMGSNIIGDDRTILCSVRDLW